MWFARDCTGAYIAMFARRTTAWISLAACLLSVLAGMPASGQLPQLPGLGGPLAAPDEPSLEIDAHLSDVADKVGKLTITAEIPAGRHIYSITQKTGGPMKTEIQVSASEQYQLAGELEAAQAPEIHRYDFWDVDVEEHRGRVTWTAPIRFASGVQPEDVQVSGRVVGQICTDSGRCEQFEQTFQAALREEGDAASLTSSQSAAEEASEFRSDGSGVLIRGKVEPRAVQPGGVVELTLTSVPDEHYHTYALADEDPGTIGQGKPTLIVIDQPAGMKVYRAYTDSKVKEKKAPLGGVERYHQGAVTWTLPLEVPADAPSGTLTISGLMGYQVCKERSCLPPQGVRFEAQIQVADSRKAGAAGLIFTEASYSAAAKAAKSTPTPPAYEQSAKAMSSVAGESSESETTSAAATEQAETRELNVQGLLLILPLAFLGGAILNLMPCVLPVIGLKMLSFAEQGGQSRGRIFSLNATYSLGLLSVFWLLAVAAMSLNLGWGEQFTYSWFKIGMTALVFAMALSFLGVWEIPIPGFVGSGKASQLQTQEGLSGAFFKGIFTTILATPCSGPFLGSVFGFTLEQPPIATLVIFTSVGLGMASPYLLIGAVPRLVRWLPKPGQWMDTFKEIMGFVLLFTVVFLFSTISRDYYIATLTLLMGIWLGCWWIGRTPATAGAGTKATSWLGGSLTAAAVGLFAFTLLTPSDAALRWQPYSPIALAKAQQEGKTVMVDFTADWCLTCKTNLKFSLNTPEVNVAVSENDVVPLLADWTDRSETIKSKLADLGSKSIPLLAIYPADRPHEPIILRDLITQRQVLEALEQAGPSKSSPDGGGEQRVAQVIN